MINYYFSTYPPLVINSCGCSHCYHHCWNAPPTASLCSHPLFGLYKHSESVSECQWVQLLPAWRNSVTHLCFIHTSTSDTILSVPLLSHGNIVYWNIGGKIQPLLPSHQRSPLMLWANIIKQEELLSEQPLYYMGRMSVRNSVRTLMSKSDAQPDSILTVLLFSYSVYIHYFSKHL